MKKNTLIFLFTMYTMGMGCSSLKLPTEQEGTGNSKTTEFIPKYSIIITSENFQADRSLVIDVLMKGGMLVVEIKEWPLDGMRGEFNLICKGDPKRIDEISDELKVTGQVSKVKITRQF